jgi:hypothetical protein
MGWGLILPSFLPSCHLLKSSTFKTISITAAIKKSTWKNWTMGLLIYSLKVIVFDDNVSNNHITVFLPGRVPLLKWRRGQNHGMRVA